MSKVVCLKNIITENYLLDDIHFERVFEDIREEMAKFG
jgi:hypothetical protein